MRIAIITFCLGLIFSTSAWSQKKDYLNSEFQVIEAEDMAAYTRTRTKNADGLYDVVINFSGGQLFMNGRYQDEQLEVRHGHFVFYNQNGNKQTEGDYSKGMKVGVWKRWDSEGAPLPSRTYAPAPAEKDMNLVVSNKSTVPATFSELDSYIEKNLKYPEKAVMNGTKGTVVVALSINAEGDVKNPKITQSVSPELDAAAMQLIMGMPKWTAAQRNGVAIDSEVIIPITFE
jgi:TonB family protein